MLKARSGVLATVIIVAFVSGISISMLANSWSTEGTKVPARFSDGEFAGSYNPADIRGSYSFGDIQEVFGIPVDELAAAFGVAGLPDPAAFQAKELEEMYGDLPDGGEIGTDALRFFTAMYTGLPYIPEESTRLPEPAVGVLDHRLAAADMEMIAAMAVPLGEFPSSATASISEVPTNESAETVEKHGEGEAIVKGRTTFADLLDWGLSRDEIELVLGVPMGLRAQTVRDYLVSQDLGFSAYREALQELLESKAQAVSD